MSSVRIFPVVLSMLFPVGVIAAERLADINVETEKVVDGVYMLSARGGNIGAVVGADGIFLIDDQFAPLTPKIRAALAALPSGKGRPVRFVLNTHFHFDHTGGNENMGEVGAVIVAHDNVRARMTTDDFRKDFLETGGRNLDKALPVVTFNDRVTFHLNNQTLETRHYPHAHTDGDSIVWFRDKNAVHMGDIYFQLGYPFIDTARGGSVNGLVRAVNDVLAEADDRTVVVPGHGALSDKAGLTEYRDMIVDLRDKVAEQIKAGKTREQVTRMGLTRGYDARWNWNFITGDQFVETLFNDLSKDQSHAEH
ncbi:MAG: MBL fold metallo-hydrolase [Proteobacteria bacterium]|nr:MBL fold metallo-hydrolase [Pseudomonadota bacterium]